MVNRRDIIVFISGKYTGAHIGEVDKNIDIARQASIKLMEEGYTVLTPHLNTAHFEFYTDIPYDQFMYSTLELMKRCDVVYFLPNWKESKGAVLEHECAVKNKMIIIEDIDHLINPNPEMLIKAVSCS